MYPGHPSPTTLNPLYTTAATWRLLKCAIWLLTTELGMTVTKAQWCITGGRFELITGSSLAIWACTAETVNIPTSLSRTWRNPELIDWNSTSFADISKTRNSPRILRHYLNLIILRFLILERRESLFLVAGFCADVIFATKEVII